MLCGQYAAQDASSEGFFHGYTEALSLNQAYNNY